jgi:alanine racemase
VLALNLWHAVHCEQQIDMLAMHKTHQPHRVFLKMNSGMNRLGFAPARFRAAWSRLDALPQVDEISLMTHFSEPTGAKGIAQQVRVFDEITRGLPGERTLSNSAASLRFGMDAGVRADWIRPGIAVYGSSPDYPDHDIAHWDLQPTMTLSARIIAVQELAPGDTVGYGSSFHRRCADFASAWWPAATPTAIRGIAAPARPCWWTACEPVWSAGSAWT